MAQISLKTLLFGLVKHAKSDLEKKFAHLKINLSPFQYGVLSMIKQMPSTLNELAQKLGVKPPSLTDPVDALVKKGYVRRTEDRVDRRKIHLTVTNKGQLIIKKIFQDQPSDSLNIAFHKLSKPKQTQLINLLQELTEK